MFYNSLLLIDDNEDTIALVEFVLENNADWQLLTALDGNEGIAKAKTERPDIILLDIAMPGISGLDVYKLLKSDRATNRIPIIFFTAILGAKEIIKSQVGSNDVEVIAKPFDILDLIDRVNKVYERYMAISN